MLEQSIRNVGKGTTRPRQGRRRQKPKEGVKIRFSPKSLAAQRRRLGLSAEDIGRLIGASGQSVYNWEAGKARPRDSHLAAIAALRTLGRKAATARLASMEPAK